MEQSSTLFTLQEVAELLKVPKKTVYHWVHRHEIPFIKVGRHLRFQPDKVLNYFENQTRENRPSPSCWTGAFSVSSPDIRWSLKTRNAGLAGSRKE